MTRTLIRRATLGLAAAVAMIFCTSGGVSAAGVGQTCGGILPLQCDAGLWCQLPAGRCGGADMSGKCARVPKACPRIFRPVCGCDGKTYGNDCERQMAKAQKAYNGRCRKS